MTWKLTVEHGARAQGLVVSAFRHLPHAEALLVTLPTGGGGKWLADLERVAPVTAADRKTESATAIACTASGLATMGLPAETLATFSAPFREGMHDVNRQRRLGDHKEAKLVVDTGALWGGNTATPDVEDDDSPSPTPTPHTVHAVVLLYARTPEALAIETARARGVMEDNRVIVTLPLPLSIGADPNGVAREHFGFADGMSQPIPYGDAIERSGPPSKEELRWHGVAAGEILMGLPNAHGEPAPGPIVPASAQGADALPECSHSKDFRDLGLDGSYLVIRQLSQDVAAFWRSMELGAATLADPAMDAKALAERVVGRTLDGAPLGATPGGGAARNLFGFAETDIHGLVCPLGSHIRRSNPRDSAPSRDGSKRQLAREALLRAANNHRILRRGRKYGPDVVDRTRDDGKPRGLLFMCLNTDIARQFEFVQQNWLLNANFATLFNEFDPLIGPQGPFTIPAEPVRRRVEIETFVRFVGGEYFFLPSLPALRYLAGLRPQAANA